VRDVTVIELGDTLCPDANPRQRPLLLAELKKSAACMTDTRAVEVTADGVVCDRGGERTLVIADTVILAAGRRARREALDALRGAAPYTEAIGDCVKPGTVAAATFRGHYAALDI
jgi:pyruvate/2-oxoglutarate dehydrogenase complex dihydrolipoamide dehydrogenase (E3) component